MKRRFLAALVMLLGLFTSVSCTGTAEKDWLATHVPPAVNATLTVVVAATQTAAITPTITPLPKVALVSFHDLYVTALQESDGWLLKQIGVPSECGLFTLDYLPNGKVTLKTCKDRFVTAPRSGSTRADWQAWQDSAAGDCGQFTPEHYGKGVAFKTCAGKYLTAGDDSWPPPLQWSVVAETDKVDKWEVFTMEYQP